MSIQLASKSIQKQKLEVLDEIDRINYEHAQEKGVDCKEKHCPYCKQLRELGKRYEIIMFIERNNRDRTKFTLMRTDEIIAKGQDVSRDEIKFLVEVEGISKSKLAKLLGFPVNRFLKICKDWNIGVVKNQSESA